MYMKILLENLRLSLPPYSTPPIQWFYDVNSAENPSNSLFDQQTPKHKTDDSKYNYIHFLLLFIRSFSLRCCDPISSSTMMIRICIETRGESGFDMVE